MNHYGELSVDCDWLWLVLVGFRAMKLWIRVVMELWRGSCLQKWNRSYLRGHRNGSMVILLIRIEIVNCNVSSYSPISLIPVFVGPEKYVVMFSQYQKEFDAFIVTSLAGLWSKFVFCFLRVCSRIIMFVLLQNIRGRTVHSWCLRPHVNVTISNVSKAERADHWMSLALYNDLAASKQLTLTRTEFLRERMRTQVSG